MSISPKTHEYKALNGTKSVWVNYVSA